MYRSVYKWITYDTNRYRIRHNSTGIWPRSDGLIPTRSALNYVATFPESWTTATTVRVYSALVYLYLFVTWQFVIHVSPLMRQPPNHSWENRTPSIDQIQAAWPPNRNGCPVAAVPRVVLWESPWKTMLFLNMLITLQRKSKWKTFDSM